MAQFRLPEDLIVETLLCFPAKSLLRFRCLSKPLHAVIDSPNFINSHLRKSSQNSNRRKLIIQYRRSMQYRNQFHVCDMNFDLHEDIVHLTKTFSCLKKKIYGYCNGLLLLSRSAMHSNELELSPWNPSTRHCMDLPNCPCDLDFTGPLIGSGLGYDGSNDEYKAFLIIPAEQKDELGFEFEVEVEVEVEVWIFELKINIWRRAGNFPYPVNRVGMNVGFDTLGCFANDTVYFLCTIYNGICKLEIVAFNVRKETFSLVPQFDYCSINSAWRGLLAKLHVLEGCLCISYLTMSGHTELYIRKNDGVGRFTWTRLFSVSNPLDELTVFRYSNRGDKILLYTGMHYLVSYDVKEKRFGRVEVDIGYPWNDLVLCLESLVPLGGGA